MLHRWKALSLIPRTHITSSMLWCSCNTRTGKTQEEMLASRASRPNLRCESQVSWRDALQTRVTSPKEQHSRLTLHICAYFCAHTRKKRRKWGGGGGAEHPSMEDTCDEVAEGLARYRNGMGIGIGPLEWRKEGHVGTRTFSA